MMKKLLLSLFLGFVGFIGFCSAGSYTYTGNVSLTITANNMNVFLPVPIKQSISENLSNQISTISCNLYNLSYSDNFNRFQVELLNGNSSLTSSPYKYLPNDSNFVFNITSSSVKSITNFKFYFQYRSADSSVLSFDYSCIFSGNNIIEQNQGNSNCESDLLTCQNDLAIATGNLSIVNSNLFTCQNDLAIATGNLEDCQSFLSGWDNTLDNCSNNLLSCQSSLSSCVAGNCPYDSGSVQWSLFYVNNQQVWGASNIYLNIPDFLDWSYTYLDSGDVLNVDVENVGDTEYIQSVIDINSYRPSSEDFTSVFVGGLTLIMPYIIFVLFLLFIRKLIKRIFK